MKTICVYLGANPGNNDSFKHAVIELAHEIVKLNLSLVYGGSSLGLMGLLATTVKARGGKAIGVITNYLIDKEKPLATLDKLYVVDSMQERKQLMQQLADFFVVVPGGLGTLEEAIDTCNAIKIGQINKKIGFINVDGFFDSLFQFINNCKACGFLAHEYFTPEINPSVKALLKSLM
ncbi:lysine decarboxylase [Legionella beliardensis]|uniref:Cytokinin riboside 5'-monophosphate phosphoribohydrolase n=1 Tax=Legionella beliardensis TaxID=91822 RepID=A0A378I407_9GAMM|nr:TIGR00730 family Rossman fold protein [Legionella beliardensis]STX29937.1 lysine decarboxylase [Legionella beliardensis]